jgi:hypothetical protein
MPRVDGLFDEVPEFERVRRAAAERATADLYHQYRDLFELVEREAPRPAILVPRGRDVVEPAEAAAEVTWHGDAYVSVAPLPGPTSTAPARLDYATFRAALERVEAEHDNAAIRREAAAAVARWRAPAPDPFAVLGATYAWPPANPAPSLLDGETDLARLLFPDG